MMAEKSVYRMSEVLASGRKGSPFRLALIHFTEMTDAERRSELEAIRSLTAINAGEKQKVLTLLGKFSALNGENRRGLASQLREDYRQDLLAEQS
jgi:endonuclease/exonuclease/phosphatase family metal-dependent hydrolase